MGDPYSRRYPKDSRTIQIAFTDGGEHEHTWTEDNCIRFSGINPSRTPIADVIERIDTFRGGSYRTWKMTIEWARTAHTDAVLELLRTYRPAYLNLIIYANLFAAVVPRIPMAVDLERLVVDFFADDNKSE